MKIFQDDKSKVYKLEVNDKIIARKIYTSLNSLDNRLFWVNNEALNLVTLENLDFKSFGQYVNHGQINNKPFIDTVFIEGSELNDVVHEVDYSQEVFNNLEEQFNLSTKILPYPGTNTVHYYIKRFVDWPYPLSWLSDNVNQKGVSLLKKLKKTKIKCGLCKMDPDPTNFLVKDDYVKSIDWQTLFHSDPLLEVGYLLAHMEAIYTGYPSKGSRLFQKNLLKKLVDNDIFGKNVEERIRMGLINGISAPIKRSYMQKDVNGLKYYEKQLNNFLNTDLDELFFYSYE